MELTDVGHFKIISDTFGDHFVTATGFTIYILGKYY